LVPRTRSTSFQPPSTNVLRSRCNDPAICRAPRCRLRTRPTMDVCAVSGGATRDVDRRFTRHRPSAGVNRRAAQQSGQVAESDPAGRGWWCRSVSRLVLPPGLRVPSNTGEEKPMSEIHKINLRDKLSRFDSHWDPKIGGELNGQLVKIVKLQGEFVWHHHEHEDELFLVLRGAFVMQFRDRDVRLEEGEFLIVPRGIEHRPVAEHEVDVLLFEPATTLNTGNVVSERTVVAPQRI